MIGMKVINQILNNFETKIIIDNYLNHLYELANPKNSVIVCDTTVYQIYKDSIKNFPSIIIPPGEQSKNLNVISDIYLQLLEHKIDRDGLVIGFGGGVVCDIAGFAAATYKRGINLGLIPTTLLSQVDASIGGKNGVNFNNYKNIVGAFKQAEFILSDISTLKSLPKMEMLNAYAEIIKTTLISDKIFFTDLKQNINELLEFNLDYLEKIIYRCAKFKSKIVVNDEKENDLRRTLNFGHTFGHAIESTKKISHGEAVSIGLILALKLSNQLVNLPNQTVNEVLDLLTKLHLPTTIDFDKKKILEVIGNDKKVYDDTIKFVLLEKIGKPIIKDIDLHKLERLIDGLS